MFNTINNKNDNVFFEELINSTENYSLLEEETPTKTDELPNYELSFTYEIEELKKYEISKKLKEIENLEEDWDNYGACTISHEVIKTTECLLDAFQYNVINELDILDICPSTYGTITINWFNKKNEDSYFYLEIGENNLVTYLSLNIDNKEISGDKIDISKTKELQIISNSLRDFYS